MEMLQGVCVGGWAQTWQGHARAAVQKEAPCGRAVQAALPQLKFIWCV